VQPETYVNVISINYYKQLCVNSPYDPTSHRRLQEVTDFVKHWCLKC